MEEERKSGNDISIISKQNKKRIKIFFKGIAMFVYISNEI